METNERVLSRIERLLDRADQAEIAENWLEVKRLAEEILVIAPTNNEAIAYLRSANAELGQSTDAVPPPPEIDAGNDKTPAKKSVLDQLPVPRFLAPVIAPEHLPEPPAKAAKWSRKSKFLLPFLIVMAFGIGLAVMLTPEDFGCYESEWSFYETSYETAEAVRIIKDVVKKPTPFNDDPSRDSINYGSNGLYKWLLGARLEGSSGFEMYVVDHYDRERSKSYYPVNLAARVQDARWRGWSDQDVLMPEWEYIVPQRSVESLTECMELAENPAT